MKNSKALFHDFVRQLTLPESGEEIRSLAYIIFDHVFALGRADVLAGKAIAVSNDQQERLEEIVRRINTHEPVQYVLGKAEFYGRTFTVNPSVLIPRPETEELVLEALKYCGPSSGALKVMDIGTGSGCIPITFKLECKKAEVYATDISAEALAVAEKNAVRLKADVHFIKNDILREELPVPELDIVISNPPYIAASEKEQMQLNVVGFEPHLALFVPEEDPLVFYKAITAKALKVLRPSGMLIVEINERFGREVKGLFEEGGFGEVSVIKDIGGKERIVRGMKR